MNPFPFSKDKTKSSYDKDIKERSKASKEKKQPNAAYGLAMKNIFGLFK